MFSTNSFTPEKSIDVLEETRSYIESSGYADFIRDLTTAYFPVWKLLPIPTEAILSGTTFPWIESHNDLQISSILAMFGLYKQAHASLRSALELALLSLYWNIDEDGHIAIEDWVRSRDSTPFASKVWKRVVRHPNFGAVRDTLDLDDRFSSLGELHDYVHTRGPRYSNALPFPEGGRIRFAAQRFSKEAYEKWLSLFEEVIRFSAVCHLVRYPLGTVRYNWGKKFGIDVPACGVLEAYEVDRLEQLVTPDVFEVICPLAETDTHVRGVLEWVLEHPDITPEAVQLQLVNQALDLIRGTGFEGWLASVQGSIKLCRSQGNEASVKEWEDLVARVTERAAEEGLLPGGDGKPAN